jgi:hypothetical protein
VVFGLDPQVLEYRVGPEALHEILSGVSTCSSKPTVSICTQLSTCPCRIG